MNDFNPAQRTRPASQLQMVPLVQIPDPAPQGPVSTATPGTGTLSAQAARGRAIGQQLQTMARTTHPANLPPDSLAHYPDTVALTFVARTVDWANHSAAAAQLKLALEAGVNAAGGWGMVRNGVTCLLQETLLKNRHSTDPVYHAAQAAAATIAVSTFMLLAPMLTRGLFGGAEIKPRRAEDAFPIPDLATDEQREDIAHKRTEFTRRQAEVNQSIGRLANIHGALSFGLASGTITSFSDEFPRSLVPATAVSGIGGFLHVLGQNLYKTSAKYEGQQLFEAKNDYSLVTYRLDQATGESIVQSHVLQNIAKAAKAQYGVPNASSHPGSHVIGNITAELCGQMLRHGITYSTLGTIDYGIAKAAEALLEKHGADTTKLDLTLGRPSTGVRELDAVVSGLVMAATLSSTSYFSGGAYLAGRKGTLAVGNAPAQPPARAFHKNDPARSAAISGIPAQPGARRLPVTGNHRPADTGRLTVTHLANTLTNPAVTLLEAASDAANTLTRRNRPAPQPTDSVPGGERVHFVAEDFVPADFVPDTVADEETPLNFEAFPFPDEPFFLDDSSEPSLYFYPEDSLFPDDFSDLDTVDTDNA